MKIGSCRFTAFVPLSLLWSFVSRKCSIAYYSDRLHFAFDIIDRILAVHRLPVRFCCLNPASIDIDLCFTDLTNSNIDQQSTFYYRQSPKVDYYH
jgi:hypothetical protein